MNEVRSKIAQYIAGEVKLDQLIDSHRISAPLQKRFMFDDTWITMNRRIGEAVISARTDVGGVDGAAASGQPKTWKPTAIQERRRNAVTVTDADKRLMTNGGTWPKMEDWVVAADNRIRYAPMLQPLRKLERAEWDLQRMESATAAAAVTTAATQEISSAAAAAAAAETAPVTQTTAPVAAATTFPLQQPLVGGCRRSPAAISGSSVSDRTYQTLGNTTPASYSGANFTDSTS